MRCRSVGDAGVDADVDTDSSGCVENCVDTEAWTWEVYLKQTKEADAGVSSRGCKVVGSVKISGTSDGHGGESGSENASKTSMLTVRSPGGATARLRDRLAEAGSLSSPRSKF